MQWTVQDNGKSTDHAALEKVLQDDIKTMASQPGVMDMTQLELRGFEAVRRGMDAPARIIKAAECKDEANAAFSNKEWLQALKSYLAGIWFLKRGEPRCPLILTSSTSATAYDEVAASLGVGEPIAGEHDALDGAASAQRDALRIALHLNLAAAALKLAKWEVARTACQFVLMMHGNDASPKARYRLAQALEGEGELSEGISVLEKLLSLDAGNSDASRLLERLKTRLVAAPAKIDYSTMGAEEWAKLSQEEQQRALEEINRQIDEEMGTEADEELDRQLNERLKSLAGVKLAA